MHLRSRYLPKPSASSPPDNRAPPMTNASQIPDLEGLHREIHDMTEQMRIMNENNARLVQLLAAANPPPLRWRRRSPSPPRREGSSSESIEVPAKGGEEMGRGRSPFRGDRIGERNKSTSQKIRDLDARLDAINTGTNTPKENESLKDFVKRFNQTVLEVEDPSDKVVIMAMMEGFRPGPLFDSLSKNIPKTLSTLQSKVDKYIAVEELAEAKRRRRGKKDHKRKEPDTGELIIEKRQEIRSLTEILNALTIGVLILHLAAPSLFYHPLTPPSPRGYLRKYIATRPSPNSPERRYDDNRPTAGDIQTIHSGFGSGDCSTSSRKRHARSAHIPAEEEIYNLSSSFVGNHPPITFSNDDLRGLHLPHDDALVVSAVIANFNIQRILIDNGSSADILFISAFERIKIGLEKLHPFHTPLIGFGGNMTHPLGRPTLGGIKAITSTYHLQLKFPTSSGIGEIKGDQKTTGNDMEVLRDEVEQITLADPRETKNTKPLEEVAPISIHPDYPDRHIMIGTEITNELHFALINFLKKNSDVFAWSQGDIPGIDLKVAMHKLFTNPKHSLVRQKRRKFAPERLKVIEDEVNKLTKANVVREAHYSDWLANVVVAPPKGRKWRVCVDFTDLNKACPKDSFSLPKIDLIVDATSKHELLIMPFGLKNAGATYQRLVNKMFKEHIGKTMEVYIDDMLVKSLQAADHIAHLEEAFGILRQHRMMLNSSKCIFGVSSGKYLGFLVTKCGIEANPDQIQVLIAMSSPRNVREVQQLTGRIAALNRFVSKSPDKWLVIQTPSGEQMTYAIRTGFKATNNEAEYEALLAGLRVAVELGAQSLDVFNRRIPLEFLASPSIEVANLVLQVRENPAWMDEIIAYLQEGTLQRGKLQARRIQYRFGIPKVIISDNARQFDNDKFKLFCSDLAISHHFSSPGILRQMGK
ncbi:hypothetical protein Acr_13g0007290 [Actinidia rufa]|uniref:Integrase catalytic domain-containing protein n=1 Tax=Actinidia rufa TaxID=165716 RepID=A0A7J0FKU2_9ERIC|nr:hypothetical protein Acr_13g0007290 [Actinidia rufa]